jgi:hypothetical protein
LTSYELDAYRMIGFDARRSCRESRATLVPPERAAGGLLRPDAAALCSADRSIWPSVFVSAEAARRSPPLWPDAVVVEAGPSSRYFAAFDLWDDLAAMHGKHRPPLTGDYGVAFALLKLDRYPAPPQADSWYAAIDAPGVQPSAPGSDWPFLGHDVVNSGFQSALAGYGPLPEIDELRAGWASEVNDLHLFFDRAPALSYCADANVRFEGDGPFYVVALFLLWDGVGDVARRTRSLHPVG